MPKMSILTSFWKPEACGQTVLPDRSILRGQKLVENAKIKKSNATFWVIFKQCVLGKSQQKCDKSCLKDKNSCCWTEKSTNQPSKSKWPVS